MTKRDEEIVQYAMSFKGKDVEDEELKEIIRLAIIDGAKWADEHPRKGMVDIDKVCKYLWEDKYSKEQIEKLRKAMEEYVMTVFNHGWWNCFCSFASELLLSDRSEDREVMAVLRGAGITADEIEEAISLCNLEEGDVVRIAMQNYKDSL